MNGGGMMRTERTEDWAEVGEAEWRGFVDRSDASVFYSREVLTAYARGPLLPSARSLLFSVRESGGALSAAVPFYLQDDCDPFGLLQQHVPGFDASRRKGLLTHCWHCYDTEVVGRPSHYGELLSEVKHAATELGAEHYGFLNVPEGSRTFRALRETNWEGHHLWDRFQLRPLEFATFGEYLLSLQPDYRRELQRQLRRMSDSGATCRIESPPFQDLPRVAMMCHETAARHGTGFYYPPERLESFLLGCGSCVRLIRIDLNTEVLGVFVCFLERDCLHLWAAGTRYDLSRFSPYAMIFLTAVRHAIEHRMALIEGGRGNGAKKIKLGFKPLRLHAFIRSV